MARGIERLDARVAARTSPWPGAQGARSNRERGADGLRHSVIQQDGEMEASL
jgi:hypothetical protein